MPDVKLSQLAAASAASVAAGAGLWTMAGHILGLHMEYVGPASIRVSSGSAWIPSLQRAIEVPSALTLSGLTLAANTWYHLYLYLNGTTPTIEAVTIAPAAPYSGTARAKTGDPSRRYIGSFRSSPSAQVVAFRQAGSLVKYQDTFANSAGIVLNGGASKVPEDVSTSACVPLTSTTALMNFSSSANQNSVIGNKDCNFTLAPSGGGWLFALNPSSRLSGLIPLASDQTFNYRLADEVTSGSLLGIVIGYQYER